MSNSAMAKAQTLQLNASTSTSSKRRYQDEDKDSGIEFIPRQCALGRKQSVGKGKDKESDRPPPEVIDLLTENETDSETDSEDHAVAGPSTLLHAQPRPVILSLSDEDLQFARKLQQELDDEDRRRREEDDKKSAEYIAWMDKTTKEMDAKRAKLAKVFDGRESGLVYQVVIDAEGRTLEGDEDADNLTHLEIVKRDFEQALNGGLKLRKVHWFVNQKLEARFENAKDHLASLGIDVTERNLFHGTAETNIQPILENGFKIGGVDKDAHIVNGAACGYGIYLATNSMTSFGFTAGTPRMFMCRIVTGRTTSQIDRRRPPKKLGLGPFEAYESNGVVVLKHVELCVPRYVVEFDVGGPYVDLMPRRMAFPPLGQYMSDPQAYTNIGPLVPAANFHGITIRSLNNRAPIPIAPTPAILQPLPPIQATPGNTVFLKLGSANKRKKERTSEELEDLARPAKRAVKKVTGRPTSVRTQRSATTKGKGRAQEEVIYISD